MKELLKKYYGLDIEYGKDYQDGMVFFINGDYYYLCKNYLSMEDVDKSFELYRVLKDRGVVLHDFVFNNDNELVSDDYVLLKLNYLIDDIDLSDLEKININVDFDLKDDFYTLWIDKIDYYEEKMFVDVDNYIISYSFDYFVGVSELLLNVYKDNKDYIEHNFIVHRTFYSLSTIDYYNPLNIIVGDRLKDYSSYIRLTSDWELLYSLLDDISYEEKVNLFIRLSFPYKYFYYINRFFYDNDDRKKIFELVEDIEKYEEYLNKLENVMDIKLFYWIKKDN